MKTDEELVRLCQQRDAHSWQTLVDRHQDRILNLAFQFSGNRESARDLAQDIFVRLYESLGLYDPARPFQTWFNSLARNLCIDHYRKSRKDKAVVDPPVDEFGDLASDDEPTDRRLERREGKDLLLRALEQLGAISRDAIVQKDLQGLTHEEMASMEGVPVGTMKSRVSRARADLARILLKLEGRGVRHGVS